MAVRLHEGIAGLDGDVDARTVTVRYDDSVIGVEQINSVFEGVGYPPAD